MSALVRPSVLPLFGIVLPLYALDQASKWWIVREFFPYERRTVIHDFFDLCYWMNTEAAFSLGFFSSPTANNRFFLGLSLLVAVGLVIFYRRGAFNDAPSRWGAAFLLSGILGNVTDRMVHGHVVDFLLFDFHVRFAHPWPAFNVADSCIFLAVILFVIASFRAEALPKEGS